LLGALGSQGNVTLLKFIDWRFCSVIGQSYLISRESAVTLSKAPLASALVRNPYLTISRFVAVFQFRGLTQQLYHL
jgi:hypothetical protein